MMGTGKLGEESFEVLTIHPQRPQLLRALKWRLMVHGERLDTIKISQERCAFCPESGGVMIGHPGELLRDKFYPTGPSVF